MKLQHGAVMILGCAALAAFFLFFFNSNENLFLVRGVSGAEVLVSATSSALSVSDPVVVYDALTTSSPEYAKIIPDSVKDTLKKNVLVIPSIGVDAPVKTMGLESDGKMAVPDNYTDIGLYGGSARPGEIGSAVMGAHVDNGAATAGVFKRLSQMNVGDRIYYFDENGKKVTFTVTNIKIYDRNESADEVFSPSDTARLNLITCHGMWLPWENTYSKRLVVFAEKEIS